MDAALVLSIASSTAISLAVGFSIIKRANDPDAETERMATRHAGAITAYKVMTLRNGEYYSPVALVRWHNGQLTAAHQPALNKTCGMYCFKSPDDPRINEYMQFDGRVLCKVALSGRVIERDSWVMPVSSCAAGTISNAPNSPRKDSIARQQ